MLLIVSSILVADAFTLIDLGQIVQVGLIGAGVGTIASKAVVDRSERRRGELPARRIRDIEFAWIKVLGGGALALILVFRVLS